MPLYIKYMHTAYAENRPTLLARILGIYRIGYVRISLI